MNAISFIKEGLLPGFRRGLRRAPRFRGIGGAGQLRARCAGLAASGKGEKSGDDIDGVFHVRLNAGLANPFRAGRLTCVRAAARARGATGRDGPAPR